MRKKADKLASKLVTPLSKLIVHGGELFKGKDEAFSFGHLYYIILYTNSMLCQDTAKNEAQQKCFLAFHAVDLRIFHLFVLFYCFY